MSTPSTLPGVTSGAVTVRGRGPRHPVLWLALAAIAFRLLIFVGRGDYVAFDEGWYLLLGRNLVAGEGYTLSGLRHVTLSPLFPLLAGAFGTFVPDPVWAGRLVAAIAGGLLVWPCWHIFHRLADRSTAWLACVFVSVMPALAPFAAPFWIRWDLWVGSEPILHLFLYGGIAVVLRAWHSDRAADWALAGFLFALAYLARSEAVLPFALLGLIVTARAAWRRRPRAVLHVIAFGLTFALTAAPYWLYLHDATGRWTLTGRGVQLPTAGIGVSSGSAAANAIERMLWTEGDRSYMFSLYSLDSSATRLASTYWGIPLAAPLHDVPPRDSTAAHAGGMPAAERTAPPEAGEVSPAPGRLALYVRALGTAVPVYLLPFILIGVVGRRLAWRAELLTVTPLVMTSVAIAAIVAADPRTQLFVAPLAAYYAARGVRAIGGFVDARLRYEQIRRGFAATLVAAVLVVVLAGTAIRWVYLGVVFGSPHHLVGAANRQIGAELRQIVPRDEPVMSWHPAIALYAHRDWRVLPHASFMDLVRYANATGTEHVVVSPYYPAPSIGVELETNHLIMQIPPGSAAQSGWNLQLSPGDGGNLHGTLRPAVNSIGALNTPFE